MKRRVHKSRILSMILAAALAVSLAAPAAMAAEQDSLDGLKAAAETVTEQETAESTAAEASVTAENFYTNEVSVDALSIALTDPEEISLGNKYYDYESYDYTVSINLTEGDSGTFVINESASTYADLGTITDVSYESDSKALTVNSDGTYTANYAESYITLTVTVDYTDSDGDTGTETFCYGIYIYPDMSKVKLDTTSYTYYRSADSYTSAGLTVKVKSDYTFDLYDELTEVSVTNTGSKITVNWDLEENVFTFKFYGSGSTTLKITINDKTYKIKVKIVEISCSTDSVLLSPGKSKTVRVKGIGSNAKIKWKSSNKKVATVKKNGKKAKIKAKKKGNAVITATVNGSVKVGCAVSVTTKKKVKAIKWAQKYIASGAKYSQSKRMQDGYYDCSALVWKAYSRVGYYFGDKSYAPTAASIAKYLKTQNRLKGKCTWKKTQKMVMTAGDLIFQTGSDNGRFKGIYHVEMFCGYALAYYDTNGKPVVTTTWASRGDGYGDYASLYGTP